MSLGRIRSGAGFGVRYNSPVGARWGSISASSSASGTSSVTRRARNRSSSWRCTSASGRRSDRRSGSLLFCLLLLVSFGWPSGPAAQVLDRVLAVVSGQVILASDVRGVPRFSACTSRGLWNVRDREPAAREAAGLSRLIERRLALDEVNRYRQSAPPPARVERAVAAVQARFADPAAFARLLSMVGDRDGRSAADPAGRYPHRRIRGGSFRTWRPADRGGVAHPLRRAPRAFSGGRRAASVRVRARPGSGKTSGRTRRAELVAGWGRRPAASR